MSLKEELQLRKPFSSIQEEALLSVFTTWDLLYRNIGRVLRRRGLSLAQYNVLRILRGAGSEGIPLMAVARRMIVRYPNVTRLTDRLESDGLIRRERSSKDRRVVRAFVNPVALDLLGELDPEVEKVTIKIMRGANDEELRKLISLLEAVRDPLRREEDAIQASEATAPASNGGEH